MNNMNKLLVIALSVGGKTCNFCEPKRKLWEGSENLSCIFNNKKRKSLTITSLIYFFIAYCHSVLIPLYLKRTIASLIVIWRDEKMCKLVHESPKRILLLRWWWFARCKILLLSCASNVQCGIQGKMRTCIACERELCIVCWMMITMFWIGWKECGYMQHCRCHDS